MLKKSITSETLINKGPNNKMPCGEAALDISNSQKTGGENSVLFLKFKLEGLELTPQKVSTNAGAPGHRAGFSTRLKPLSFPPSLEIPK